MTILKPSEDFGFGTKALHSGAPVDPHTGAVIAPISLSTTFAQSVPGHPIGNYDYSRSNNPSRENFEIAVASLENAKHTVALASGSAGTALILQLLPIGSHVVAGSDVYGGTHRYFTRVANTHGIDTLFVVDLEAQLEGAIKENTKLVWLETPSNPTLRVTDVGQVSRILRNHERKTGNRILFVVDNTFVTPYISNPLNHGADIVIHSVSKYINGHSDVIMGAIATNEDKLQEQFRFMQNSLGNIPSPFDAWLAQRGLKTLHLRVRQSSLSALAVAEFLEHHPAVIHVNYPGLESYEKRSVVLKQHRDGLGGGMVSFRIKGGAETATKFSSSTRLFTLAESLGGIESLLEVPAVMTHGGIPKAERELSGVHDDLIRLSVGIEETVDLVNDIKQAIEKSAA